MKCCYGRRQRRFITANPLLTVRQKKNGAANEVGGFERIESGDWNWIKKL
jgi:hypothetical protein